MSGIQYGVSRGEVPPYPKLNVRGYGHSIAVGASASRVGTTNFYARLQNTLDPARYTMSYTGHGSYSTYSLLPLVAADVDAFLDPDKINLFLYM